MSQIKLTIGAVPATPAAGDVTIYPKSDKKIYIKDDTGAEVSFSPPATTDALTEGATNKYFTDERAQDAVAAALTDTATIDITYNDVANTITADLKTVSIDDSHIQSSAAITLSKLATVTVSRALVSSGAGVIDASTVTAIELGHVSGVTSPIQGQLAAKADTTAVTAAQAFAIQRVNHTGTQLAATVSDFSTEADARIASAVGVTVAAFSHVGSGGAAHALVTTSVAGFASAADKTKLDGIETAATANSSDATLLARANHTGTQLAATVSDFSTAADARIALKIEDLLVDGVTTKAPSQNVVYDALYTVPTKVAANDVTVSGTTYTILTPDKTLYVTQTALCVITLPTPTIRRKIVIKDMAGTRTIPGQEIRVARNGAESIDGINFRRSLYTNYGSWTLESDGANWFITG